MQSSLNKILIIHQVRKSNKEWNLTQDLKDRFTLFIIAVKFLISLKKSETSEFILSFNKSS